ncbi:LAMI_0H06810g1_1 [Lachancea mirantina]|uniref:LAMI_0H06810g1_1 n=1 Tax=Lachancea mirantina TaxID=1230905 RepID=A0A1G4KFD0_9SACH|nr:LAMI_0H06810g1_1 [Lachancea mirantina]
MTLSFLPGQPNVTQQTACQSTWCGHPILAYCSGNNLIILSDDFSKLQTLYLPSDCVAVDIDSENGWIAVAFGNLVHVYKPLYQVMKSPKWVLGTEIFHDNSQVNTLSWGATGELVIGSDYLSFWKIRDEFGKYKPYLLWTKKQFKPVYLCKISDDSQIIASMHKYSKIVKLWKRISIGGDEDVFDLTIISHPDFVTTLRWRRTHTSCSLQRNSHILYTLCQDRKLRLWTYYELDTRRNVQQWGVLSLGSETINFCAILDSWLVEIVFAGVKTSTNLFFSTNVPDIVATGDAEGNIVLYALDNLSHDPPKLMATRRLKTTSVQAPFHVFKPYILYFAEPQAYTKQKTEISLIVHDIRGVVRHELIDLPLLLSSANDGTCFELEHKFTGHEKSIQKLARSSDGESLVTLSRFTENSVWVPERLAEGMHLRKKNIIHSEVPVREVVVLEKGSLVVGLLENLKLVLWKCPDVRGSKNSVPQGEFSLEASDGLPMLLLNTPEKKHRHNVHYIAVVYSTGQTKGFEITFQKGILPVASGRIELEGDNEIYKLSAIDPVNYGFLADRSLISVINRKGIVRAYKAIVQLDKNKGIDWVKTNEVNTGLIDSAHISGSSINKMCIVDKTQKTLTLWDMKRSFLEYRHTFDDKIVDIDWTSTKFSQSVLSVGFETEVLLYTQLRYDYTTKNPSFLPVEKIDISQHTSHAIGDSVWLTDGTLVIASGNQLFVKDKSLDLDDPFTSQSIGSRKILSNDILHLSGVLNGPLPVYHPQFLIQALYAQKVCLVREILLKLFLKLRDFEFNSFDIATLGSDLEFSSAKFLHDGDKSYKYDLYPEPYTAFTPKVAEALRQKLMEIALPFLTRHQQVTLITIIEAIEDIDQNEKAVDYCGLMFILGLKLLNSHKATQKSISMRDVLWAIHSANKNILFLSLKPSLTSWDHARESRVSFWLENRDLVKTFEDIAKYEFNKDGRRDPTNCAIFYYALKKKHILMGLWRVSAAHPEQQKILKFLNNDFNERRWKTAAFKNAFVLLSKHRYMDAACFFLLAGSLKDAASVLMKQCDDICLAVGVCRVYEGDSGPVLRELLLRNVLPGAIENSDRWVASFFYSVTGNPALANEALLKAPACIEENEKVVENYNVVNQSFLVEDPALLHLYRIVRDRSPCNSKKEAHMNGSLEYDTLARVVGIYSRMGCDYLGLSVVKNWVFCDVDWASRNKADKEAYADGFMNKENAEVSNMQSKPGPSDVKHQAQPRNILDEFFGPQSPKSAPKSSFINSSSNESPEVPRVSDHFEKAGKSSPAKSFKKPPNLLDAFM